MKRLKKVIKIPKINDGTADFKKLFKILKVVRNCNSDIYFDFSSCSFLRPNAVVFLGGVARLIEKENRRCVFLWDSFSNKRVFDNLKLNGFSKAFGGEHTKSDQHSIPYREDLNGDPDKIMDYLNNSWLKDDWLHISSKLSGAISGKMWEIYINAFEHSDTKIGVYSCGQHFEKQEEVVFSVIDFGQGIPLKIRNFASKGFPEIAAALTSEKCLLWAFQSGNSTKSNEGIPRGLGLDLLKEFVVLNEGKLEVYSNDGYVRIEKNCEEFKLLENSFFSGTIFHITLKCDENYYKFKSE